MKKSKSYCLLVILMLSFHGRYVLAQLDNTFSSDGKLLVAKPAITDCYQVRSQSNGKLVMAGESGDSIMVVKLNTNGTMDNSFSGDGILYIKFPNEITIAYGVAIQSDDKIVLASHYFDGTNLYTIVIRLNSDGSFDNTFDTDGFKVINIFSSPVDIAIQSDGKIVILTSGGIYRLNSDGSMDTSFDTDGIMSFSNSINYDINDFTIQPDGKILVAGAYNNNSILMRVNSNGSFDNGFGTTGVATFDVNNDVNDRADALTILENGSILVSGYITNEIYLMKLNVSDGSIDNTFGGGDGVISYSFPGAVNSICHDMQEDTVTNDILVSGTALYGTVGNFALARISSVGSVEAYTTVNMSNGTSEARSIFIQSDRKIVIAGYATESNKVSMAIARFVADFSTKIDAVVDATTLSIGINLFPNPANYHINIHSTYSIQQVQVIDVLGNEVLNRSANGNLDLDISMLPKGLYSFVITTDKGIGSKKVSIQ